MRTFIGIFLAVCMGMPVAQAAEFYFGAPSQTVGVNTPVEIGVFLNTEGERINAVEGSVTLPPEISAQSIREGNSIISFWPQEPKLVGAASIDFQGIVPGGYVGTQGYLFSIIALPTSTGKSVITVTGGSALLNNGSATPARLHVSPLRLTIAQTGSEAFVAPADTTPPEDFTPFVAHDPDIFAGKAFLVFSAQDKGSGIDHYAVQEGRWGDFITATSPYELKYQSLNRMILVKAVDAAGNERVVTVEAPNGEVWYERFGIFGILVLIGIGLAALIKKLWPKRIH